MTSQLCARFEVERNPLVSTPERAGAGEQRRGAAEHQRPGPFEVPVVQQPKNKAETAEIPAGAVVVTALEAPQ